MTVEIQKAIAHVSEHHPSLDIVIFTHEGRWCYMDSEFNPFVFNDKIDVSILEKALDSLPELPAIFTGLSELL